MSLKNILQPLLGQRRPNGSVGRRFGVSTVLCLTMLVSACSFAPKYEQPKMETPEAWMKVQLSNVPLEQDWWTRFDDPVLTALIEEALRNNQDIAASLASVDSAAAQIGQARSSLFPSLTLSAGSSRSLSSTVGPNQQPSQFGGSGLERSTATTSIGFAAAWELDLWGKYRNAYTGLTDILLSTKVGYEALRLSVAGQVAQAYFTILSLDMQQATAERTLRSRRSALSIYSARFKQGDITELDWLRAESEMELAKASMLQTRVDRDAAEAALAVLVGRSPQAILQGEIDRGRALAKLAAPTIIPHELPATLLLNRPDIRAAEYTIMAYNANIGVAKADLFPSISLTATLGSLTGNVFTFLSNDSATNSYGGAINLPIFDFGRRWYAIDDAEALKRRSEALYRKTVQTAYQDVRTALTAQREATSIVRSIRKQVNNYRRAVELARLQYNNGYADYLTVLDTERQLFTAELQLASALSYRLNAVVRVAMALGGGWVETGPPMGTAAIVAKEKAKQGVPVATKKAPVAQMPADYTPAYDSREARRARETEAQLARQGQ